MKGPVIKRVIEVGSTVNKVEDVMGVYLALLGGEIADRISRIQHFKMIMLMIRYGNIDIELMSPTEPSGTIYTSLQKRGPGFHHVAFEVDDIYEAQAWMQQQNLRFAVPYTGGQEAIRGAFFLHPQAFDGVLFEFLQGGTDWVRGEVLPVELQSKKGQPFPGVEGLLEVGVAVSDLESTSKLYTEILGADTSEVITVDEYDMRIRVCRIGSCDFALMESMSKDDPKHRFIGKDYPGLHHFTLKVVDIDQAIAWLINHSARMIDETPRIFGGVRYAFIHPETFQGTMIGLSERRPSLTQ
ncbi:VOC family protein [Chloroflexota bacterium]